MGVCPGHRVMGQGPGNLIEHGKESPSVGKPTPQMAPDPSQLASESTGSPEHSLGDWA